MRSFRSHAISIGVAILQRPYSICYPFFALVIAATWSVRDNFFFWDTMQLASQHAHFFYENNNFSTFLLPDEMDSGHPPTFGFYLALMWKMFGKSLTVSHLAMLPFLLGIVWQAWKLGEKTVGEGWTLWFMLLLIVSPVVAGQAVLVSPDIVLLFFFLMALNAIFNFDDFNDFKFQFNTQLAIAILGLSAISLRGMMVVFALFIFYFLIKFNYFKSLIINSKIDFNSIKKQLKTVKILNKLINKNELETIKNNGELNELITNINEFKTIEISNELNELITNKNELKTIENNNELNELATNENDLKRPIFHFSLFTFHSKRPLSIKGIFGLFLPFLLGISFAFSFLLYHFMQKGWIGFHADSPWMPAFQKVNNVGELVRNGAILMWRLIDFGHLFLWLICIYGLIKNKGKIYPITRLLMALLIVLLIVLTPTLLIYKGLLAHRYLMPIYVVLILLTVKIISDLKSHKRQLIVAFIALLGLASGNFWVYPQPISTGWDATLAHLPYYKLRREMLQFIDNQQISYSEIGSAFPNQRDFETIDLKERLSNSSILYQSVQNRFSTYDLSKNRFVFYSNVFNEFSDADLIELKTNWRIIKSLKSGQVEVILFEKNK
jgi:hypothetical protein